MHGDALRCSEMLGDAWRCLEMLGDAQRCSEMLGDAWRCSDLLRDAWRCLEHCYAFLSIPQRVDLNFFNHLGKLGAQQREIANINSKQSAIVRIPQN